MSDAPEVPSSAAPKASSIGDEIKKMPPWGWLALAGVGFVAYKYFIAPSLSGSSPTAATSATTGTTDTTGTSPTGIADDPSLDGSSPTQAGGTPIPVDPSTTPTGPGTVTTPTPTPTPTQAPTPTPAPKPPTPAAPSQRTYTVVQGDTLSGIGQRFGVPWESIYNTNQGVIEQTAEQRSGHSSDYGNWIYPGEVLAIP